ncbi:MAG: ATP-binding protein [Candidatus Manganitrophaceae bacterium]
MNTPKKRHQQLRFFFFLFLSFFLLLSVLFVTYLVWHFRSLEKALGLSDRERLKLLGEAVRTALPNDLDRVGRDSSFLREIAVRKNIRRIRLFGANGAILADSHPESGTVEGRPAETVLSPSLPVLEGEIVVEKVEGEEGIGRVWIPLAPSGMQKAEMEKVQAILLMAPLSPREDARTRLLLLFAKLFGVTGTAVFGYYFFRFLLLSPPADASLPSEGTTTETGFVIHTFQNLIHQLKRKEQELEQLKGRAEEHARRIEGYNENILQSVTSGVLTFDCEGRITTFNPAAGTILSLSAERVMGKSYETVFGTNQKIARFLDGTLCHGNEVAREECEVERPDGKRIWLGLNTSLLRDRDGRTIGATLVFTDLSDMKMLQDQVELKKRLAVMGEMSAWIAHEFRNYMGTILGFSRLLSKKLDPVDPKQEMIKAIIGELSAMERLITELLAYGRKTEIHPSSTSLGSLLEELKEQFIGSGAYPHIRWILSLGEAAEASEALVDPILIRQAFSNLIQNALEAMLLQESGELRIVLRRRPEGAFEVEIADTGPGIPKEYFDRIFLPFFTTKEKGTGLGLALVHKIVVAHRGQISVENGEGIGAIFRISLPFLRSVPYGVHGVHGAMG